MKIIILTSQWRFNPHTLIPWCLYWDFVLFTYSFSMVNPSISFFAYLSGGSPYIHDAPLQSSVLIYTSLSTHSTWTTISTIFQRFVPSVDLPVKDLELTHGKEISASLLRFKGKTQPCIWQLYTATHAEINSWILWIVPVGLRLWTRPNLPLWVTCTSLKSM